MCLEFLVRPDKCSVDTCDYSIVLTYGVLVVKLFDIITEAIVAMASFYKWMFISESEIASV